MIRLTARLVLRSTQWAAPLMVVAVWVLAAVGSGGNNLSHVGSITPAFVMWGIWMVIITGNIDDDPHRDLLAAALGSAAKVHTLRSVSAIVMSVPLIFVVSILIGLTGHEPGQPQAIVIASALAAFASATLIGESVGSLLHPPLLRRRGVATLLAVSAFVVILILPTTGHILRSLTAGHYAPVIWLLAGSITWTSFTITAAAKWSAIRAR